MAKNASSKKTTSDKRAKSRKTVSEPEFKPRSLGRRFFLIVSVIVVICIIGVLWFALNPGGVTARAQLIIDSGVVQVRHDGGWFSAENGTYLYQSDSVRTGDNSSATIVLFESSMVRLDSNTEVTLQELIREGGETSVTIDQGAGRTWNTVSKISGIDDYEVQTPTTVASVRGTAFVVIVESNGTTYYGVSHGVLNVSSISNGTVLGSIDVSGNESVVVYVDMVGKTLEVKPFDKDDWVLQNLLKDEQFRLDFKAELYSRIEPYIPDLKDYGMTDEEIDTLLDGYILGYLDLPPETPEWVREIFELS